MEDIMKKSKLIMPICMFIFIATYLLVVLLSAKNYTTSYWVCLAFVIVSYLIMDFALVFTSKEKIREQVVGLPVGTMSVMYFALELVLGTVFMFVEVSFLAYFLPQIILFSLFLLCFIPAMLSDKNYKSEPQDQNKEQN